MATIQRDGEDGEVKSIKFVIPDDWHLHVRDGEMLYGVIPYSARAFERAIIMPNLVPPVTTTAQAVDYRHRILQALPADSRFQPLMTLYLTDSTSLEEVIHAMNCDFVRAFKLYPAGATTNSGAGVTDIKKVYPVLELMQEYGVPLLMHGEITDPAVDIFDREAVFIDRVLIPLRRDFPTLRIVFEHITTKDAVHYVAEADDNIAATITAHHLHINRNDILVGGIRPHNFCMPVAKREIHRQVLVRAATSGRRKFFLGTDSAPHAQDKKESACGCAGCFTAPSAIELYLRVFEQAGALENFEAFASFNGPDFYGLPRNTATVTYESVDPWHLPEWLSYGDCGRIVPFMLGEGLHWRRVE